jgi:hypothetical protein
MLITIMAVNPARRRRPIVAVIALAMASAACANVAIEGHACPAGSGGRLVEEDHLGCRPG